MKLSVNGSPVEPTDLVRSRILNMDPTPAELYLVGFLAATNPDDVDLALTSIEAQRKVSRELEIMRKASPDSPQEG